MAAGRAVVRAPRLLRAVISSRAILRAGQDRAEPGRRRRPRSRRSSRTGQQPCGDTTDNYIFLKVLQPDTLGSPSLMPTFGFTPADAAKITLALASLRKADLPASRVVKRRPPPPPYRPAGPFGELVTRYRCLSCHSIGGSGGDLSTVPLDRIGSQLQHDYLVELPAQPRRGARERRGAHAGLPHAARRGEDDRRLRGRRSSSTTSSTGTTPASRPPRCAAGRSCYGQLGMRRLPPARDRRAATWGRSCRTRAGACGRGGSPRWLDGPAALQAGNAAARLRPVARPTRAR